MIALHPYSALRACQLAHLRIMETTDIHVHVYPYDYYGDRPSDAVGLARTATLINGIRAEATNAVLVDNGDFLQGNPLGDYMAYEKGMKLGDVHPVIAAMNTLGVEVSTLGNHEFNYGLSFLEKSLAGANFPVVSANVIKTPGATPRKDQTLLPPYVILDREICDGAGQLHPIKIGFIGAVAPQITQWDHQHLHGNIVTRDIVWAIEAYVPEMKERGADLIIALAHSGIGRPDHVEGAENAAIPVGRIAGVDAVMTGHQHLVFPSASFANMKEVDVRAGTIGGTPAVMGGCWGSHMGLIDLLLERDGNCWKVISAESEARPIYLRGQDHKVRATVVSEAQVLDSARADHEAALTYIRRPVGRTTAPLHSYFALVANDPSVQIVSIAQHWYMHQMLRGSPYAELPLLSAAAPFKAGGRGGPGYYSDVPAGDLAIRNVADLYLYSNTVRAVKVTGASLKNWLERSAGAFNRIVPGQPEQLLLNPDFPNYNFDVIDGVSYCIDLSQPSRYDVDGVLADPDASRIVDLSYRGTPIDPAQEFVIATNNFRANGGGNFPGTGVETIIFEGPDTNRDVLLRHIMEKRTISPCAADTWRFSPMPGTSVLFDTGPKAQAYVQDLTSLNITPFGTGPDGFVRYKISL
ncbi:2', 3'-cyclic nucleotide 2'-phosphodiesterase [Defluviimonas sp. 20V17]|uniref:2',3'-cyclic-nucleotide 2'-phosphodiesterase n=1 Tax=Allgaiera indica TaxID=765699 RepID=A0AAN4UN32_9RHOB|nr:bifunctional 2',3'-cyclic-nucleotide 2'-phosphodiesterase/3'-nucleotidase [Allgaiera indica]KDB03020.1 2', 3'-cyclic nucleotide 2'-phosphodiesterase [Defluviimonas sp. 20V17]GHD98651.1 2',3'-cyclic-nucleotide 2'-phosphodiesterase [Allgaiera indica]SDW09148.1 2',3'-cyclic-nucleotide 2'-phosphodiesterase / 3'-nucleotidase [Allgaiera indica]